MPGQYPAAAGGGATFFPLFSVIGWLGTPTTSAALVSLGAGQSYATPYKACTVYMMSFSLVNANSVASSITLQPYGSLTGGNGGNIGTAKTVSVPSSGPFVTYSQAQSNLALGASGYIGVLISSSVSTASINLGVHLWVSQSAQ